MPRQKTELEMIVEQHGLTKAALAKEARISYSHLDGALQGTRVRSATAYKILNALNALTSKHYTLDEFPLNIAE